MILHVLTLVFVVLHVGTILFQIALVLGKPWGYLTQGGRNPGVLPVSGRVIASASTLVLAAFIIIILVRSGHILPEYYSLSVSASWVVVGYLGLGLVMNLITPSKSERKLWAPILAVMLVCALGIVLY